MNFNNVLAGTYEAGTQYNALSGNDHVIMADTLAAAAAAGYDPTRVFDAGAGDDVIIGGSLDDIITGNSGNDQLFGNAGDDQLAGDDGDDLISGGAGNDFLFGGMGNDTITGDDGNDYIEGNEGADNISGGNGNDLIDAGDGNDIVSGGSGDDTIVGGAGNDTINGDDGDDNIAGDDGNDILAGGNGSDLIEGGAGNDTIDGGAGDDYLYGDDGDDIINGGDGNDVIGDANEAGNDILNGNAGDDIIQAGAGDDILDGGLGTDLLYGDTGNDTFRYSVDSTWTNAGSITPPGTWLLSNPVDTIASLDVYAVRAAVNTSMNMSHDIYAGGDGFDTLYGTSGNDFIYIHDNTVPSPSPTDPRIISIESIETGDGNDIIDLRSATVSYGDVFVDAGSGNDVIWTQDGNDAIDGGDGFDVISSGAGDDLVNGGAGNDMIDGGSGDDYLIGGSGIDTLFGGDGQDILEGGTGVDFMNGGTGDDMFIAVSDGTWQGLASTGRFSEVTVQIGNGLGNPAHHIFQDVYQGGDGYDTIMGTGGNDVFILDSLKVSIDLFGNQIDPMIRNMPLLDSIEHIVLGDGNDVVNLLSDRFNYTTGVTVEAGNGDDYIWTQKGDDTLYGGAGNDRLDADMGNDQLFGGDGNDVLLGREGDDILDGGAGNDQLYGGSGNDTFVYHDVSEGSATETIQDFQTGADTIHLEDVLSGFNGNLSEFVRFVDGAGFTIMQVDIDGLANGQNFVDLVKLNGVTFAGGGVHMSDVVVS
ncbi:MAG: calcium-binding protein [Alphaproteobacteria bacterium]|nr:MAG: calcium-binding protein [Alphaproteobacteria bacterium]